MERFGKIHAVSLRAKVLAFLMLIIFLFMISNFYSIYQGAQFERDFDQVLTRYYTINRFRTSYSKNIVLYDQYLEDMTEENWMNYIINDILVRGNLGELVQDADSLPLSGYLLVQSIKNMYNSYSQIIFNPFEGENEGEQRKRIQEVSDLIDQRTGDLLQTSLSDGFETYRDLSEAVTMGRAVSLSLMILVVVIAGIFASFMVENVLNPVKVLSNTAKKIEEEQFEIPDLPVKADDEMGDLNRSFNQMKWRMKRIIIELKEKQKLSEKLHEQELKVINSEKLLEKAKFSYLQSQINPHFLFNTLNVISGMANMEHAKITNELILCLSRLFRYNLDNKADQVPLSQELMTIKNYIYIEKKRFGERLNYVLKADVDVTHYEIPPFTLQPLIENSIKHGILKRENGGTIAIKIFLRNQYLVIRVLDNGIGMTEEKKAEILGQPADGKMFSGVSAELHTDGEISGIGIQNVAGRLKLTYSDCDVTIYSRKNRGTSIEIRIAEEECRSDKAVDCG